MDSITVKKISETEFDVTVGSSIQTRHRVTVPTDYCKQLTDGKVSAEELVERSFEFLLQREPNTSILSRFALPVIGRYFPRYEQTIREML